MKAKRIPKNRYVFLDRIFPALMITVVAALVVSAIFSISIGEVHIDFLECYRILWFKLTGLGQPESSNALMSIIWLARTPRIIMSMLIGAALSLCGVTMQSSVQNPLADPYILGTSSGASLGATFVIMLGFGGVTWVRTIGVSTGAFVGATGASLLVLLIAGFYGAHRCQEW